MLLLLKRDSNKFKDKMVKMPKNSNFGLKSIQFFFSKKYSVFLPENKRM